MLFRFLVPYLIRVIVLNDLRLVIEYLTSINWIWISKGMLNSYFANISVKLIQSLHVKLRIKSFNVNAEPIVHFGVSISFEHRALIEIFWNWIYLGNVQVSVFFNASIFSLVKVELRISNERNITLLSESFDSLC